MTQKITPCFLFADQAEEAANYYVALGLPDSRIDKVQRSVADTPGPKAGDVLVIEFTLEGQRFIALNGGPDIGRDPSLAKVVVPDTRVSKRHLRIVPRDGKVWAIDQGSTNGTFVDGRRIATTDVEDGEVLTLGATVIRLRRR